MADTDSFTRQVNGQDVARQMSAGKGPIIWSDDRGYRTVDWTDRSWRADDPAGRIPAEKSLGNEWVTSGPFAADINHILISHANPNVIYAAVGCGGEPFLGGVYRSTNGGQDWVRLAPETQLGPVYCLTMNPENHLELFASAELGLFHSTDAGNSWSEVFPVDGSFARSTRVSYNPAGGGELMAHYYCEPPPDSSLFRSTDGGVSFAPVDNGLPQALSITDICFDPQVGSRVFISVGSDFGEAGVYCSEDHGAHWLCFNDGLDGKPVNSISVLNSGGRCSVMVTTGRNFANQNGGLFHRSHPFGEWFRIGADQVRDAGFLEVQRNQLFPGLILVGAQGQGMLKSTDNGLSWSEAGNGLYGEVVNCISFQPDGMTVHTGCESMGFFTSLDQGSVWTASSEGINMVKVTDVAVDDLNPDRILVSFTSLNSGGVFITENGGSSWYVAPNLVDQRAQSVAIEEGCGQVIYAAMEGPVTTTTPEGIYKSTDGGQSWVCTGPHGASYLNNLLYKVVVDPQTGTLLAGGRGYVSSLPARLFRSTDSGDNWVQVHQGDNYSSVMDIAVSRQSSSVCYGAVDHTGGINGMGGVLKSTDNGASWSGMDGGFPAGPRSCRTVSVDPSDSATVYSSLYNHGVYKTTDGGSNWLLAGFPASQASAVLSDPLAGNIVYACSGGFPLLRSKDGGVEYQVFGIGYPENSVYRFGIDDRIWQPRLFACGTQGLYRLDLEPLGLPDTLDLTFNCSPAELTLPDTTVLSLALTNCSHLYRSYWLTIDLELPGGTTYFAYRRGSVVLSPDQLFSIDTPVDFPMFGSLVGVSTFILTGTDTTPPGSNGGLPGGFSDVASCQIIASMP
jgi:photosystem II stability/assembly factor-like uncharacterized protein